MLCFYAFPEVTKEFGIEQRCPDNLVVCVERIERCVRKYVFFIIQMEVQFILNLFGDGTRIEHIKPRLAVGNAQCEDIFRSLFAPFVELSEHIQKDALQRRIDPHTGFEENQIFIAADLIVLISQAFFLQTCVYGIRRIKQCVLNLRPPCVFLRSVDGSLQNAEVDRFAQSFTDGSLDFFCRNIGIDIPIWNTQKAVVGVYNRDDFLHAVRRCFEFMGLLVLHM